MIEHGTVKSVDSLPSATPANRHTSGIIIYPALSRKRSFAEERENLFIIKRVRKNVPYDALKHTYLLVKIVHSGSY